MSGANRPSPSKDISPILESWEPGEAGTVLARLVRGDDGEEFLQLRLDLGVLQMALDGRPDGTKPFGCDTLLDHFQAQTASGDESTELSEADWEALDSEIMQYYHRRIGLLASASEAHAGDDSVSARTCYERAARDAEHNLGIMDFIRTHADDETYVVAHEHYRPFVLYHRTVARSQYESLCGRAEAAIDGVKAGIDALRELPSDAEDPEEEKTYDVDTSVRALEQLDRELRKRHGIDRTLSEQLSDAVEREDFEEAARLRDRIRHEHE